MSLQWGSIVPHCLHSQGHSVHQWHISYHPAQPQRTSISSPACQQDSPSGLEVGHTYKMTEISEICISVCVCMYFSAKYCIHD